jgi:hypothetical protein
MEKQMTGVENWKPDSGYLWITSKVLRHMNLESAWFAKSFMNVIGGLRAVGLRISPIIWHRFHILHGWLSSFTTNWSEIDSLSVHSFVTSIKRLQTSLSRAISPRLSLFPAITAGLPRFQMRIHFIRIGSHRPSIDNVWTRVTSREIKSWFYNFRNAWICRFRSMLKLCSVPLLKSQRRFLISIGDLTERFEIDLRARSEYRCSSVKTDQILIAIDSRLVEMMA